VSSVGNLPNWTPDGEVIYSMNGKTYLSNGTILIEGLYPQWIDSKSFIYKKNLSSFKPSELMLKNGNTERTLLPFQVNAILSPNKQRIAYAMPAVHDLISSQTIFVCDADGKNEQEIYIPKLPELYNSDISWSPDSSSIIFSFILYTMNEYGVSKGEYKVHLYNLLSKKRIDFDTMKGVVGVKILSNGDCLIERQGETKIPYFYNGKWVYLQLNANSLTEDIFNIGGYDTKWLESDMITVYKPNLQKKMSFSGNRVHERPSS